MFGSAGRTAKRYEKALAEWQAQRDSVAELLTLAESYDGETTGPILLRPDERVFATVNDASLIEDRRGRGQWVGRSNGVSIPVGFGVRYRMGATRGHYQQGSPVPTAIDSGTLVATSQRIVFQGQKQTREALLAKLVAYRFEDDGVLSLSVSNRQKNIVIAYGPKIAEWVQFRILLATSVFQGSRPALVDELRRHLSDIDTKRPSQ